LKGEEVTVTEHDVSVVGVADPATASDDEIKKAVKTNTKHVIHKNSNYAEAFKRDVGDIRKKLKGAIAKTFQVGLNTPVNAIAQDVMKLTGIVDERWVQYTNVEVQNNLYKEFFVRVPKSERMVFVPHCLRDVKNCVAEVDEEGYHCKKCGKCAIAKIWAEAEKNNQRIFMTGGGSQVISLIGKYKPKAIVGVACFNEIQMALEKLKGTDIPVQAVMLRKAGCVNTIVDVDDVFEKMNMEEKE